MSKKISEIKKWPKLSKEELTSIGQNSLAQEALKTLCSKEQTGLSDMYTNYRGFEIKREKLLEAINASTDPTEKAQSRQEIIYLEQDWDV